MEGGYILLDEEGYPMEEGPRGGGEGDEQEGSFKLEGKKVKISFAHEARTLLPEQPRSLVARTHARAYAQTHTLIHAFSISTSSSRSWPGRGGYGPKTKVGPASLGLMVMAPRLSLA